MYYASLGADSEGNGAVVLNVSVDGGDTWSPARVVVLDDGVDKDWLSAIGPDPSAPERDNLYVTWTSFKEANSELWLAKSTDGGSSWTSRRVFAPPGDANNSPFIQFSNPVVDRLDGRLYVPFLHGGNFDADHVRVVVSDDGGETFRFLAFDLPGAIDAYALPNVTPGILNDCGLGGGLRNALKQGSSPLPGRFGAFSYERATRLITQPAAAVFGGRLVIAVNSSTSDDFWDPAAGSGDPGHLLARWRQGTGSARSPWPSRADASRITYTPRSTSERSAGKPSSPIMFSRRTSAFGSIWPPSSSDGIPSLSNGENSSAALPSS